VSPVLSAYYGELHRGHGVDVRLGASVTAILGDGGRARGVRCADNTVCPADLVVVGIGVIPNAELAGAAGLACDRGIVVDRELRTADPRIYAIGDCAAFPHPMATGLVRLESVQNAVDQGKAVADAVMGDPKPYTAVPWFWSDQYDAKLQIVGLTQGYDDTVTLGNVGEGRFSVLYFRAGALIGIDSVNRPSDHVVGRKLFAAGKSVTPAAARVPGFDLRASL
jgi:3-phenylpropionate/trans-cinnamate dioxygenase ferredoxin reductase subunit